MDQVSSPVKIGRLDYLLTGFVPAYFCVASRIRRLHVYLKRYVGTSKVHRRSPPEFTGTQPEPQQCQVRCQVTGGRSAAVGLWSRSKKEGGA